MMKSRLGLLDGDVTQQAHQISVNNVGLQLTQHRCFTKEQNHLFEFVLKSFETDHKDLTIENTKKRDAVLNKLGEVSENVRIISKF